MLAITKALISCAPKLGNEAKPEPEGDDIHALNEIISLIMSAPMDAITSNAYVLDRVAKNIVPWLSEGEKNTILDHVPQKLPQFLSNEIVKNKDLEHKNENDLVQQVRFATPNELAGIAFQPDLPSSVTSIIISRGFSEPIRAIMTNKTAKIVKSGLSMVVELAFSDLKLKESLINRIDIPESLLTRLLPYLNETQKIQLFTSDFAINNQTAIQYLADERAAFQGNGIDPSRPISDTISRLCREMRIYEIANTLAQSLSIPLELALNLLNSRMDYCRSLLLNAAGADKNCVLLIINLKQIKNVRFGSDPRAVLKVFQEYTPQKALNIVNLCAEKITKLA